MKRTPLRRYTRLRKVNRARLARRRATQFGTQAQLCRESACCVCGARPAEPHHVRSRGAGGTDSDTVPLCRICHNSVHQLGVETFERRFGVDLREVARRMAG